MGLTVHQQPQTITPAYNAQTFVALSNQIAITDFKYIVTVQVNGGVIFTSDILQRPDGHLVYDPIEWVKNFIKRDFNPDSITCLQAIDKAVSVEVKIKEYYSGAIQSTSTINYTAYDACLTDEEFYLYNYTNYTVNGTNIYPLQNPFTLVQSPDLHHDVWLHFFRNSATDIKITYTSPSLLITFFTLSIPTTNNLIYYANVGARTLLANGITPEDGGTVDVEIKAGATIIYSTQYVFADECTKYTKYALYYLDRYGNIKFKSFNFLSRNNSTKKINKVILNKSTLNATTHLYNYKTYDRDEHIVSTTIDNTLTLNTDYITEEQSELLNDLFTSPIVWLYDGVTYRAVTINDTNYESKKHANEQLFNLEVKIDLGVSETRQRGI